MTRARLHAMTQQEGRTSLDVIIGTLLIFGQPAFVLIDPGATYSFMSSRFALHANVLSSSLPGEWHVSLPSGEVMRIAWVFSGCEVLVEGAQFKADLIPLDMVEFDVILGMDFLETYRAMVDCFRKEVVLRSMDDFKVVFQGESDVISSCLISAVATRKLLNKGCQAFLAHVVDASI